MFQFKSKTFETELTLCDEEVALALANEKWPNKENTAFVDSENSTTEGVLEGEKGDHFIDSLTSADTI